MTTHPPLSGIHHITAITTSVVDNLAFYRNILGLRLVKQTVNFDDPYTYHLYYGDARGAPGTILTFFPWEDLPQGKPGAGMVTAVAFSVPLESMNFWRQRISAAGAGIEMAERFGDPVMRFADPGGLPLELVGTAHPVDTTHWSAGHIDATNAIRGLHSATATLNVLDPTADLLTRVMGMALKDHQSNRYRFVSGDPGVPGHCYDLVTDPQMPLGRSGGGTVHHIAFRTPGDDAQLDWQSRVRQAGLPVTDVRDRKYFHSIYFRSPGGVLFEIATDPPGFAVDEPQARLGRSLQLPRPLEPMRSVIEERLPALNDISIQHVFKKPLKPVADDNRTLVLLHGTGGSERDLIGTARQTSPSSTILSLRGPVLENGRPRFFRRIADNVFDEQDVVRRAHQISNFLVEAAPLYSLDAGHLTALGYSNGANMAAAMLLLRPEIFTAAVLLRPMLPLQHPLPPDLRGKSILVLRGTEDTVIPSDSTDRLVTLLQSAGAEVFVQTVFAGHEITTKDLRLIADWLRERRTAGPLGWAAENFTEPCNSMTC